MKSKDLNNNNPEKTEVSSVICDICGHEWVAVRPEGLTKLECPSCENLCGFENKVIE